jgi:predicted small lipoprotein YifL
MHQYRPALQLAELPHTLGLRGSQRILTTCLQDIVMPIRNIKTLPLLACLCIMLVACGQSGELYLPEPQQPEPPEQQDR